MKSRTKRKSVRDPGQPLHRRLLERNVGPVSGMRLGKIPRPTITPGTAVAPVPQKRQLKLYRPKRKSLRNRSAR